MSTETLYKGYSIVYVKRYGAYKIKHFAKTQVGMRAFYIAIDFKSVLSAKRFITKNMAK